MKPELYNDKEEKIKQREYSYAERYVGVRIAPNGQMKTEYSFRLAQALELSEKLSQSYLTRAETTLAYQSRLFSLLGFYLPITCFLEQQCERLQTSIY